MPPNYTVVILTERYCAQPGTDQGATVALARDVSGPAPDTVRDICAAVALGDVEQTDAVAGAVAERGGAHRTGVDGTGVDGTGVDGTGAVAVTEPGPA